MFSIKKTPVRLTDTFFTDLVRKLHHPDKDAIRRAALEAISLLKTVNRDTLPQCQFNLDELKAIDAIDGLDDSMKRKLCKEITKVFVGSSWTGSLRSLFDQAVEAHYDSSPWTYFFGQRPALLPIAKLSEKLNLIYEILYRAGNASAAHIEEISANSKLLSAVHPVVKGLPPGNDLGKIIELCRVGDSFPELFEGLVPILFEMEQNRNMEALAAAVSLFKGNRIKDDRRYSFLLKELRAVPKEERQDVISYAKQLIGDEYIRYRVKAIAAIASIPKEERQDVINKAAPLKGWPNVLRAVCAIPADDRENVLIFLSQVIKPCDRERELVTFLRIIRAIPKEEREDVIAKAKLLSHESDSLDGRAFIIFTIACIPMAERREVIDAAIPLIRESDDGFHRMKIIEAMAQTPSADRMYASGKATLFIDERNSCLNRAPIIKAIIDIPKEEREDAIEKSLFLINREIDNDYGASIIIMFGSLSREERANVFSLVMQLIRGIDSTWERKIILETLIAIPEALRAEAALEVDMSTVGFERYRDLRRIADLKNLPPEEIPLLLTMVGNNTGHVDLAAVFQKIRKIPKEDREDIWRLAKPLIKDDEGVIPRMKLFEAIARIPKDNRAFTVSHAALLTHDRRYEVIRRIPIHDLEDVISKSLLCLDEDSTSCNEILEAMATIPARSRADVLNKVLPFLTNKRDSFNIGPMLKAMGALSPQGRAEVISVAHSTIKERDTLQCQTLLLKILAGIVDNERADVMNIAASFNRVDDGTWGSMILAEEIGSIKKEDRLDVVEKAKVFVKEEDRYERRVDILKAIKLIQREARPDVILVTQALMKKDDNCLPFLEAISGIPQPERADVIEKAAPLIGGAIDAYCRAHLLQSISVIPKEERTDVIEKTMILVQEGADLEMIIQAIGVIPKEERTDVLDRAHLFFKFVFTYDVIYQPSSYWWAKVIKRIGTIPKEERLDVINTAASLINDDNMESCYCILDAIGGLAKEERANFALTTPLLMAGIRSSAGKIVLLGLISRSFDSVQFIKNCFIICNSNQITLSDYKNFRLVPQNDYLEVVNWVANDPDTIHGQFWKGYTFLNALFKERHFEHITAYLDTLEGEKSVSFAELILHWANDLLLEENHPLVQKAIALIYPEDTNDDSI